MTDSYNLFHKKAHKLLIIHGMNNNASCFGPIKTHFQDQGYDAIFITLPCHGDERSKIKNFKAAFASFDTKMREVVTSSYSVLAFSHGALYLQLWLEKNPHMKPLCQVLLAPALYVQRYEKLVRTFSLLPGFFPIKSFSPKAFRRYQTLTVREYRILFEGIKTFQKHKAGLNIPTLLIVDPLDELINVPKLKDELAKNEKLEFMEWNREYLKKGIGRHHILFHPDYFEKDDWEKFTGDIREFLTGHH